MTFSSNARQKNGKSSYPGTRRNHPRLAARTARSTRVSLEPLEGKTLLSVTFGTAVAYNPGGISPNAVATGDFNADGRVDVVTASASSRNISVLLGSVNGTFQPAIVTSLPASPNALSVGDVNGDGKLDVVTAAFGTTPATDGVRILLGNGNGTFQGLAPINVLAPAAAVAVGDLNADGKLDVVTANLSNNTSSVLLGNGNGTFQSAVAYPCGTYPDAVAVGDFNGDGRPDVATANRSGGNVGVLLGNGNGTFQTAVSYAVGGSPVSVATKDLNGDGKLDLVTANSNSANVSVLVGNGNGTFQTAVSYGTESTPTWVAVGDLNNDGRPDLVTANNGTITLSVLMNNGNGSFRPQSSFSIQSSPGFGANPTSVAIGDQNGDGKPDLITSVGSSGTVNVLLNTTALNIASDQAAVTGDEGSPVGNSGTFDDFNGRATVTMTASLGTVTMNPTSGTWTWSYTPPDNTSGPVPVIITARDTAGQTATTSFSLAVDNVAPSFFYSVPSRRNEGQSWPLVSSATDPAEENDPLTYTWTITHPNNTKTILSGAQAGFIAPDNGTYFVNLTVADDDGGSASKSATVGVTNVPPTITTFSVPASGAENSAVTVSATATDPAGANDPLTYNWTITRPDGTILTTRTGTSATFTPPDNGNYGVSLIVSDDDGGTASRSATVAVTNVAPTVLALDVVTTIRPENSPVTVRAVATDPAGVNDPLTFAWTVTRPDGTTLTTLTGVSPTFTPQDNGDYGVSLTVSDGDGGTAVQTRIVSVFNVAPTVTLNGPPTGLATQLLTYSIGATDASPVDRAVGFTYDVHSEAGKKIIAATAGNGSGVTDSYVYYASGAQMLYVGATDKDGGLAQFVFQSITVLDVTSANLQSVINQQGSITFRPATNAQISSEITAVNGLSAQAKPVTITIDLGGRTFTTDTRVTAPTGVKLVVANGTLVGGSPALIVDTGDVVLDGVTTKNATDAPTIVVNGGKLGLRNSVIEESTTANQVAVMITGGTVDLGTKDDPGGNIFKTHGNGELIHNSGGNGVSAVGNDFEDDGGSITSPYRVKDKIFDALNVGGGGLVTYVPGQAFITVSGGSIQRGIDAIAKGGTVNVEGGSFGQYDAGNKLLTVHFENGPTLSQQPNPQDPSLRDLVVTGTTGDDHIQFNPVGHAIQAQVQNVPNGRFNPSGRIVAYGLDGDDDIKVAGGTSLPAWLFGGDGNDRLQGGGGNNLLVGGAGDDDLYGGAGRNVLIGGLGSDRLVGGGSDDLLIAGYTAFDDDLTALDAILDEWTSARSYANRVANLSGTGVGPRNNGDTLLTVGRSATVFDDGVTNRLQSASGMSWYFAKVSGDVVDTILGLHDEETIEDLGA